MRIPEYNLGAAADHLEQWIEGRLPVPPLLDVSALHSPIYPNSLQVKALSWASHSVCHPLPSQVCLRPACRACGASSPSGPAQRGSGRTSELFEAPCVELSCQSISIYFSLLGPGLPFIRNEQRLTKGPQDKKYIADYTARAKRQMVLDIAASAWKWGVPWAEALDKASTAVSCANPRPKASSSWPRARGRPKAKARVSPSAEN